MNQTGVPITISYDSSSKLIAFVNYTTNIPLIILRTSTFATTGFSTAGVDYSTTATITECFLTSTKIVYLSGNNSFYLATNLGLANYSFLNSSSIEVANVLAKIQLTTDSTGIEFYSNMTSFKTRFYDTNITSLHIVLYNEDFKP